MLFEGKFIAGEFVPSSAYKDSYRMFVQKCENTHKRFQIEIKQATRDASEGQVKLFYMILEKVADTTGSSVREVLSHLTDIRLLKVTDQGYVFKDFAEYSTKEFSDFIDQSIMRFNDDFDLQLNLTKNEQGKTILNVA
jgi:hypothetical protein